MQTQRKLNERHDFWLACGHHLLDRDANGWLAVTDEFLVKENRHRPDVLKAIQSPTLVPGESF